MKLTHIVCSLFTGLGAVVSAGAIEVNLYVDSAPNAYGSPDYPGWKASAFNAAAGGTFVNMANSLNSAYVGSTRFALEDDVVYSFGDLGRRVQFVYWIPNETIATLTSDHFSLSMDLTYDGVAQTWWTPYNPTSWVEYDNGSVHGVMGTAGDAWWGAYLSDTPAALAADLNAWASHPYSWTFTAHADGMADKSLTANYSAPDGGSTFALLALGSLALGFVPRQVKRS